MIWRFLSDGGNKIQGIRFSQHNQTEHIAGLTGDRYLVRVQVDGAESPIDFNQQSPQVLIYAIRGGENKPKYDSGPKTLTLMVDPKVEADSVELTAKLAIRKSDGPESLTAVSWRIEADMQTLVFHFPNRVETGKYRIELAIKGVQAINQPEIDIE